MQYINNSQIIFIASQRPIARLDCSAEELPALPDQSDEIIIGRETAQTPASAEVRRHRGSTRVRCNRKGPPLWCGCCSLVFSSGQFRGATCLMFN